MSSTPTTISHEAARDSDASHPQLSKAPTGIAGLDDITEGGLPKGRPTLICGGPGCGKTMLAIEFLVRGITEFGEPGVLVSFEETAPELTRNVRSLGFDLDQLVRENRLRIDYVQVEREHIEETGEYDLEGLFVRLGYAIDQIGARRVVLDTIESLFGGLSNTTVLRAELRRLFRWLKDRGVTAVITGERGEGSLTRQGLEEYVSDCVILLDHRIRDQVSTRRLRIVKYRGSTHGTNEYPFLIDEDGISVLPITSAGLQHDASIERLSSGIPRLDTMLGGAGYYRGSSIMVSGTAGTGKTTLAASFVEAACARGERCLYFAFEESRRQIVRNMRSVGIDLSTPLEQGRLEIHSSRPTLLGLEAHLTTIHKAVRAMKPSIVVMDPISAFTTDTSLSESRSMLLRLVDYLKNQGITAFFTALTSGGGLNRLETSQTEISSLIDTWLLLRDIELGGERNLALYVLKSRGMAHSHQIREFLITHHGVDLVDVYSGPDGVLTGSMRQAQEARERAAHAVRQNETDRRRRAIQRKRQVIEAQMAALRSELETVEEEDTITLDETSAMERSLADERAAMGRRRGGADTPRNGESGGDHAPSGPPSNLGGRR
jgi:circadian clock protein KaiC